MKRVNVIISNEAHEVLLDWKKERGSHNLDEALDTLLKFTKERLVGKHTRIVRVEEGA
jgi:hypothetical protein